MKRIEDLIFKTLYFPNNCSCGGKASLQKSHDDKTFYIRCGSFCGICALKKDKVKEAVKNWNILVEKNKNILFESECEGGKLFIEKNGIKFESESRENNIFIMWHFCYGVRLMGNDIEIFNVEQDFRFKTRHTNESTSIYDLILEMINSVRK